MARALRDGRRRAPTVRRGVRGAVLRGAADAPPPHRLHGLCPDEMPLSISPRKWILLKAARKKVVVHLVLHVDGVTERDANYCTSRGADGGEESDCIEGMGHRKGVYASARSPPLVALFIARGRDREWHAAPAASAMARTAPTAVLHVDLRFCRSNWRDTWSSKEIET